jgi:hypothetical protein
LHLYGQRGVFNVFYAQCGRVPGAPTLQGCIAGELPLRRRTVEQLSHTVSPVTDRRRIRGQASAISILLSQELINRARATARRVAMLLPPGFEKVLPRGYTLDGGAIVMNQVDLRGGGITPLHGYHYRWGNAEAAAFERDLVEGWLTELATFMRWQLRDDPEENVSFQQALRELRRNWQRSSA